MQSRHFLKTSPLALAIALLATASPLYAQETTGSAASTEQSGSGPKFQQAQDMRYGAALYHYFQGNTFDALSTLMVAEQRGGITLHADNADLIRGGISLAFGLERQAAGLFEQQLAKTTVVEDQQRLQRYREIAWVKLAELNYRHQNWDAAAKQLEKSGAPHQSTLNLNLAIRSGDLQQAQHLLTMAELTPAKRVLGHINLAAAFARQQQLVAAAEHYRRAARLVEQDAEASDELRILRDKARIGAGYALALNGDYPNAASEFRSVRLDTPWSDDALLGLGWAAVNSNAHQQAVDALGYLIQKNPLSPQVQEALLALPYSYEQLARPKLALQAYQHAERQYAQALADLSNLHSAAALLQFAEIGVEDAPDLQRNGWLEDARIPALIRSNRRYLLQMMQSDRLQLQLAELRDLQQLQGVLRQWQQRLPEFDNLIDERARRRTDIVQRYRTGQYDQQVEIAQGQLRKLKASLAQIETNRDGLSMLEGESAELLQMVREAEQRYAILSRAGKTRRHQQQTLERARGLLTWQAAERYHDNLWQKRKAVSALAQEIEYAGQNQRSVEHIAAQAPQLNQLSERVSASGPRVTRQLDAVERASQALEAQIRSDMQTALAGARARVEQYMAHSRLAIARIQDAAMQGQLPVAPPESISPTIPEQTSPDRSTAEPTATTTAATTAGGASDV